MAEATAATETALSTVGDALGSAGNTSLDRFVAKMVPEQPKEAAETTEPAKAEPEAPAENNADLSQAPEVETPKEGEEAEPEGLSAEQQARIQKRIDKEVRKRKEAEERAAADVEAVRKELDRLRSEADELRKKQPEKAEAAPDVDGIDPRLLGVPEIKKIWETEKQAERAYKESKDLSKLLKRDADKAIRKLNELGFKEVTTDFEAEEILSEIRDNALRRQLAMQGHRERTTDKFWQGLHYQRQEMSKKARELYPWLGNKDSAEYKHAEAKVMKRFPQILDEVDGEFLLARLTSGELAEAKPKETKPTVAPVIPPKPPAPPKAAAKSDGATDRATLLKQVEKSGAKESDLAAMIRGPGF